MVPSNYNRSVIMVIMGGVLLSLLGIGDRNLDNATVPQIAFYRAVSQSIFFAFIFILTSRKAYKAAFVGLGRRGWFAAFTMSMASFLLIMSFQYTLIANAVFFISLTPLFAAILAWLFLRENIDKRTTLAMAIALIGVCIIFGTNINGEGVIGMVLALMMAFCYAGSIVIIRTLPKANIVLICTLNALMTLILMLPLMDSFILSQKDLMICLGLGIVQVGMGTALVMAGAQHVPAAQVSILALLEVVLSPLWVWIFVKEVPSLTTVIGGAIVLCGVIYQVLGAREARKRPLDMSLAIDISVETKPK